MTLLDHPLIFAILIVFAALAVFATLVFICVFILLKFSKEPADPLDTYYNNIDKS